MVLVASHAQAQIYDSLDAHPPRWYLDESDCDARVTSQGHLAEGGVGGGACETITFAAGHGTKALLVYPIEPVRPLDDLTANVSVMSARSGARTRAAVETEPEVEEADEREETLGQHVRGARGGIQVETIVDPRAPAGSRRRGRYCLCAARRLSTHRRCAHPAEPLRLK